VTSSIVYARRGEITLGGWACSFRGVREAAWFALDDVAPFLALLPALLLERVPNGRKAR
jgi:hypothetical protein